MFLHLNFRTRNKPLLGHRNWTWFMLSPVFYMRLYPMLRIIVLTPKLNLDHMSMALLVVQVQNLRIRLQKKLVNCQSTNLLWHKPWLHLNPPKRWVYFWCNRQTRRVTNSLDGIERRVRIIVRLGIGMRMLIMTRTPIMMGGTSKLNVRLSSLASYVRTITSLTCALISMKCRYSWHRAQLW